MASKKTNKITEVQVTEAAIEVAQVNKDAVTAVLIVSLMVNLFVLVGWVTLQVTSAYDAQVAAFLFIR